MASEREGLAWQVGVWNRISDVYSHEIDRRFVPVVEATVARAELEDGQQVLDLGTGTGAVAVCAAAIVGSQGRVIGVDISPDMLAAARRTMTARGLTTVSLREGRAETLPVADGSMDVVLASLSLMYVIDRAAAAQEIARVLRSSGRLVAAVWAEPEQCDIVLFQQTAGSFAAAPPVPGVGPGSLADPSPFLKQLADAGIQARVERGPSASISTTSKQRGPSWQASRHTSSPPSSKGKRRRRSWQRCGRAGKGHATFRT